MSLHISSSVASSTPFIGMKRVSFVRVVVDDAGVTCWASGLGSRLPRQRRIPVSTAIELRRGGVPAVFARGRRRVEATALHDVGA